MAAGVTSDRRKEVIAMIKCELWVGTKTGAFFKFAELNSISKAKKYIKRGYLTCYKEIRKKEYKINGKDRIHKSFND